MNSSEEVSPHSPFPTSVVHASFNYVAKSHFPIAQPTRCYYNCSHYRKTKGYDGCPAKLILSKVSDKEGFSFKQSGIHTCETNVDAFGILNCTCEVNEEAAAQSLIRNVNAQQAAKNAVKIVKDRHPDQLLHFPTIEKIVNLIHSEKTSTNWTDRIHEPPLSLCVMCQRMFLQFDIHYRGIGDNLERMIGWAHPKLMDYLSIKTSHFWDGTFHVSLF